MCNTEGEVEAEEIRIKGDTDVWENVGSQWLLGVAVGEHPG